MTDFGFWKPNPNYQPKLVGYSYSTIPDWERLAEAARQMEALARQERIGVGITFLGPAVQLRAVFGDMAKGDK